MFDSNTQSYTTTNTIARNICAYDPYKKLKTHLDANDPSDTATSWGTPRTEDYTYDANFDYLTGYRFDGGAWTTNTYDAAGNRNDVAAVDNLNRAGAIGGSSRTYDILGNTLTMGATKSMGWDVLNRMSSFMSSGATTTYAYRADGLRVKKRGPGTSPTTTYYRYDGQMPVEEFNYRIIYPVTYIKVLRYALGARGIDRIERVPTHGATLVGYPLYDAHGNNIATLTIDHANHFSVPASDKRSYDAWGGIRTGNTTGEPHGQYCANLGHLADDESGLIYMRARYYDAGSGRFVSEDPATHGGNGFAYVANCPSSHIDPTGKLEELIVTATEEEAELAASASIGKVALGRVAELVLYIETRYEAAAIALTGYGTSRAGEFMWRFQSSLGNSVIFRFNIQDNLLKFNSISGPNFSIPHHQALDRFIQDMLDWVQQEGL